MATSEVPSLVPRDRGGPSPYARYLLIATRLHSTSERVLPRNSSVCRMEQAVHVVSAGREM